MSRRPLLILGLAFLLGCGRADDGVVRFWAMGREGEVVQELVRDFEAQNPGVRVEVQQIPWSAAHEKLLTAYVGGAVPDLAQLGNTWIAEFAALDALAPWDDHLAASGIDPADQFPGVWETNKVDGTLYGVPWYVDTRLIFYRSDLLAAAGFPQPPRTWAAWRAALEALSRDKERGPWGAYLPLNEWALPVILGLQNGASLLADHATRGAFTAPEFRGAFDWLLDLYDDGLAPVTAAGTIANMYQEFERGTFAMVVTGPWNLGEFKRRLPAAMDGAWATAPMPGPDGPGASLAGGSSLVVFRDAKHADAARRLAAYLSQPEQQARFYELTGDLPAHRGAWPLAGLEAAPRVAAFRAQLERAEPTPVIPEWEQIADLVWRATEAAARGAVTRDEALTRLDRQVDDVLEKRRWLRERREVAP
ncbi:MAG TPA: sugar ABC transporter substrate-binding protein [Candidatus Krumholzibacteria bacterium]|nr:sugar ABC transporter substrate-binding protein [Candidatus Krumholzibacteria bacterium]